MSLPEGLLWQRLRRKAGGAKFRRQHPIGPYILDFYCASAKLATEIDGASHAHGNRPHRDEIRDAFLIARGLKIVRLEARKVLNDPDAAADMLARAALPLHRPAVGPPPHALHGEEFSGAC
ncbi:endonuclease domain-containing protein [Sphingomonas sp. AP4-R1]|uniref:endonuclease domain-containing protein n=1 Tax=Sphingomonas sp. AP4-R1 TaxID=2735134 RepID=UPI0020A30B40|nr:endonuclease domain-containing protein [Sphingomonas sp. AP4-R1]